MFSKGNLSGANERMTVAGQGGRKKAGAKGKEARKHINPMKSRYESRNSADFLVWKLVVEFSSATSWKKSKNEQRPRWFLFNIYVHLLPFSGTDGFLPRKLLKSSKISRIYIHSYDITASHCFYHILKYFSCSSVSETRMIFVFAKYLFLTKCLKVVIFINNDDW